MSVATAGISAILSTVADPWQRSGRQSARFAIKSDAALRRTGGRAVRVMIVDLSTHGFRVETQLDLALGDRAWLRLPSLAARPALVVWRQQNDFGCSFDDPLHPAVLKMIVDRA